jgi:hypothetical protein
MAIRRIHDAADPALTSTVGLSSIWFKANSVRRMPNAFAGEALRSELRLYTNTRIDGDAGRVIKAMLLNSVMS